MTIKGVTAKMKINKEVWEKKTYLVPRFLIKWATYEQENDEIKKITYLHNQTDHDR